MLSLGGNLEQWIVLNTKLLVSACDLGCFSIGGDLILICGGYTKEVDSPFLLTQHRDFHALNRVKILPELEKIIAGESFAVTGVGMRNKEDHNKIMISSNRSLYMFSRATHQFC